MRESSGLRRSIGMVLFALGLAACVQIGTGSSGGSGGAAADAGSEAGSACDGKKDCAACRSCAATTSCAAQLTKCNQNPGCVGIDECSQICGVDQSCIEQCFVSNPEGVADYDAAATCLFCDACPSDCAGFHTCK